ncbi:hypothetical protein TVAG_451120 [Trichomonas vaginalis G3]|uniref:Sulfatase N-terminal domain-containing protein n=1 Tax=Trichomonas vaginalis (strain ATCC PRA-98 / G3) TaxID=412133 RepID=A2EYR5_TRIV3|nr:arylsulfatase family member family [Trichomonas vaginalis G3]EAY02212.1 hypothetical protein TVAG_451120 [Trichomonas vaginalis G3]KAI5501028.1 arylsulfatase family member family [Trichomonas vaginalis G3]|eukprot:XP_001314550.1 hypothetical protein [Trichomonas vaginalis G3]
MKLPPTYLLVAIIAAIPNLWICIAKYAFEPASKIIFLDYFNLIILLFRQICEYAFIACIHYWIYRYMVNNKKLTKLLVFVNLLFYGVYFEIFGFALYDYEFSRNNFQIVLPSIYYTYLGRYGLEKSSKFVTPLYEIPNSEDTHATSNSIISDTIKDNPPFWITTLVLILIWFIYQAYFLIRYRWLTLNPSNYFIMDMFKSIDFMSDSDFEFRAGGTKIQQDLRMPYILHILAVLHIIFSIEYLLIPQDFKTQKYVYLPYLDTMILALTHFEKSLTKSTKKQFLNYTRSYLPPGRRWIDTRDDPVYPAVHGDMKAFCAYNKNHPDCQDLNSIKNTKQKIVEKLPNVVFLVYESMTPSYYMLNKDYITEHAHISKNDPKKVLTKTPYFTDGIAPNLNKFSKYAITFSGISSLGIPTSSGWHALLTGLYPSQSFTNIVEGGLLHSDDLPSMMRQYGYRSFYVGASLFSFDGSDIWIYRRPAEEEAKARLKCLDGFGDLYNETSMRQMIPESKYPKLRQCSEEEVNSLTKELKKKRLDFPKMFDYSFSYQPGSQNCEHLGIKPDEINKKIHWPGDRLTAAEVIYHWKQNKEYMRKNNIDKPIFAGHLSIEGHIPYKDWDLPQFYDSVDKYKSMFANYSSREQFRGLSYLKVTKIADKYQIGEILSWLKENDPNTIFVVTGDHGTRDIPIHDAGSPVYDDVVFKKDCVHRSSGTDSFFVTSGMIGYLGNDERIKKAMKLDKFAGQTLKIAADHNDLVYTLEELLNDLNGTDMQPTHRRSRNLIKMTDEINTILEEKKSAKPVYKMLDEQGWKSFSLVSYNGEYREGSTLLRTHPSQPDEAHIYHGASYPQCLRLKDEKDDLVGTKDALNMFQRMGKMVSIETYLNYHNRVYNFAFRDNQCIEKGDCKMPEPQPLKFINIFILALIIPPVLISLFGTLIGAILSIIYTLVELRRAKKMSDEAIILEEEV